MSREKIFKVIEIVVTAILSIAGLLLLQDCTATMSISKYNTQSPQQIQQSTSVDSTHFIVSPNF